MVDPSVGVAGDVSRSAFFVVCGGCGRRLTDTMSPGDADEAAESAAELTELGDQPGVVLPPGVVRHVASSGTDHGCCGSDGCDGPNRSCDRCGRVVGTMRSDCWTPKVMHFLAAAVTVHRAPAAS